MDGGSWLALVEIEVVLCKVEGVWSRVEAVLGRQRGLCDEVCDGVCD